MFRLIYAEIRACKNRIKSQEEISEKKQNMEVSDGIAKNNFFCKNSGIIIGRKSEAFQNK